MLCYYNVVLFYVFLCNKSKDTTETNKESILQTSIIYYPCIQCLVQWETAFADKYLQNRCTIKTMVPNSF